MVLALPVAQCKVFHCFVLSVVILGLFAIKDTTAIDGESSLDSGIGTPGFKTYVYLDVDEEMEDEMREESNTGLREGYVPPNIGGRVAFSEPAESTYWGPTNGQPVKLTNTSWEEFRDYALRGIPVVVTDASRGWPMQGWTCEKVGKLFGREKMRQEYSDTGDQLNQKLGDLSWIDVKSKVDNGPNGPGFAPFYWDVKDRRGPIKEKIKELTALPYFMSHSRINRDRFNETCEFWFSATSAGAKAHSDEHCESTVSVQLAGKKRWRLGMLPQVPSVAAVRRVADSDVDTAVWEPRYDFVLEEGEALFFPPGFIHETQNVGEGCAISVTYQWDEPSAAVYIREWLPRLSQGKQVAHCRKWDALATLSASGHRLATGARGASTQATQIFDEVDVNSDNVLTRDEITEHMKRWRLVSEWYYQSPGEIPAASASVAKDAFAYHDVDEDGVVSRGEFMNNYKAWTALRLIRVRSEALSKQFARAVPNIRCYEEEKKNAIRLAVALELSSSQDSEALSRRVSQLSRACQRIVKMARTFIASTTFQTYTKENVTDDPMILQAPADRTNPREKDEL